MHAVCKTSASGLIRISAVVAIAMAIVGCDRAAPPPQVTTTATAATRAIITAPTSSTSAAAAVADESLPADQYVAGGLSAYDRDWLGNDMKVAATKLTTLVARSPGALPRYHSERSERVFDRIVSSDNLRFFGDRSIPLAARFPGALDFIQALNAIAKLYMNAFMSHHVRDEDFVELLGAQLRCGPLMLDLTDELLPTISKSDPNYARRMAGLEQIRVGLAGMVMGSISTLSEADAYSLDARGRMLTHCRQTLPRIAPNLTAPNQLELSRRLTDLVDDPTVAPLREQVIQLRDDVEAALHRAPKQPTQ